MKTCSKHNIEKYAYKRVRNSNSYIEFKCKSCDKERSSKFRKNFKAAGRSRYDIPSYQAYYRNFQLEHNYGINLAIYNDMLKAQDNKCAGCKKSASNFSKALAVDHCHKTNKIRGLLCNRCNLLLGKSYDNPEILRRLADYLEIKRD